MADGAAPIRIWYQGFTDADVHKPYVDRLQAHLDAVAGPGVTVRFHGVRPPAAHLHAVEELRCSLRAMANALAAEEEGYDAFALGHFQEAGLHEIKAMIDIPAVGLGEASMLFACTLGRKIGLVTIDPVFVPWHEEQVARAGLGGRVVGIAAMRTSPADYMKAFVDEDARRAVREQFRDRARPLLDAGAEVLIPAGGLPMLLLAAAPGFEVDGAPVMNGITVLVKAAETAVRLKRIDGLAVSRRAGYARPSAAALAEFRAAL